MLRATKLIMRRESRGVFYWNNRHVKSYLLLYKGKTRKSRVEASQCCPTHARPLGSSLALISPGDRSQGSECSGQISDVTSEGQASLAGSISGILVSAYPAAQNQAQPSIRLTVFLVLVVSLSLKSKTAQEVLPA